MLNTADATLTYQGTRIDLTKNEFKILQTLMEQKGKVVSREKLMERLWESDSFVDENTLSVNVNRLRKKLDAAGPVSYTHLETENGEVIRAEVVDTNGSGHGALAGFLQMYNVNVLICGGIGAGAKNALAQAGIQLFRGVQGNADQAVNLSLIHI